MKSRDRMFLAQLFLGLLILAAALLWPNPLALAFIWFIAGAMAYYSMIAASPTGLRWTGAEIVCYLIFMVFGPVPLIAFAFISFENINDDSFSV